MHTLIVLHIIEKIAFDVMQLKLNKRNTAVHFKWAELQVKKKLSKNAQFQMS